MPTRRLRTVLVLAAGLLAAACASTRGLKELDPKSRDFISKVRYTITAEERKAFLALAPEAREPFIEDFWARRDPTPGTAENEYRTDYYDRIERSNRLFSGGGSPGWLQDRGRVYITLGPPDSRITYPRGVTFYGLPTEIWWYGMFSILFIDQLLERRLQDRPGERGPDLGDHPGPDRMEQAAAGDAQAGRGRLRGRHRRARCRDRGRRGDVGPVRPGHPLQEHLAQVLRRGLPGDPRGDHEGLRPGRRGGLDVRPGLPRSTSRRAASKRSWTRISRPRRPLRSSPAPTP